MYMMYFFKKRLQLYIYTFNALFLGCVKTNQLRGFHSLLGRSKAPE